MSENTKSEIEVTFPLYTKEIREFLPHRYPMLLVDRVIEVLDNKTVVGIKNVTANEEFFLGHFPEQPIMPGVLMLEALAQLGVIYAKICANGVDNESLYVFAGADEVRFRRPVVPGDVLRLEMTLLTRKKSVWKMKGVATVEGELAAEAILTAAALPRPRK